MTMGSAHVFWPPLTVLVMCMGVVMFLIIKYGDKLCKARTVPFAQSFEIEEHSSDNTTYICEDEKASYRDMMVEDPEMINLQETGKTTFSKECAV